MFLRQAGDVLLVSAGRHTVSFLENTGEIQRLPVAAEMRDLRDAPAGQLRRETGGGDLQTLVGQELMGRESGLVLKHPAEIVVAEGQGAEIGVQLEIAVRIVPDDAVDDLLHHAAVLLALLQGRDVIADQVPVGREERNAVLRLAEVEEGGGERVQQKTFSVAPDDRGLG